MQIRKYHSLSFAISKADSNKVCYLLVPDLKINGLMESFDKSWKICNCSMVVLSVPNWNDDLTPWPAPGAFRKKHPFGGKAKEFLGTFLECMGEVEESMGFVTPERYLMGVSLSGLFAVWTLSETDIFSGVASISGSLWYDGFVEWLSVSDVINPSVKVFMCLGERERFSKDKRISQVEMLTDRAARILEGKDVKVEFQLVEGTHFSPLMPRIELALEKLL